MEPEWNSLLAALKARDTREFYTLFAVPKDKKNEDDEYAPVLKKFISLIHHADEHGNTLLHILLEDFDNKPASFSILASLIKSGAPITKPNHYGMTPIKMAYQANNKKLLEVVVEAHSTEVWGLVQVFEPIKSDTFQTEHSHLDQIFKKPVSDDPFFFHYEKRESGMDTMLRISHFDTIYNMFVGVLILFILYVMINNLNTGTHILNFEILFAAFGSLPSAVVCWMLIYLMSFSAFAYEKVLTIKDLPPMVGYVVEIVVIFLMNAVACHYCLNVLGKPPPLGTSFLIMAETCRLNMKIHAYMMTNKQLRVAKKQNDPHPSVKDYPQNVTFYGFFEFTWLPTLIYQTRYPRLPGPINWKIVFKHALDFSMSIAYAYVILDRFIVPQMMISTSNNPLTLLMTFFSLCIPGILFALLAFFGLLHSWFNAWAEITRFGDRWFYSDWWNVRSMAAYYRRWNAVVHNFLHRYIYMEALNAGLSKFSAMAIVFLLSAAIHEYLISVAMGFWKPVLTILFVGPGLFYIWLTNHMTGWKGWNIFFWANLIIGHGILPSLYGRAWIFYWYEPERIDHSLLAFFNPVA